MPNDANIGCKALFDLVELIEFNVRFKPKIKNI
jgi:hypothetical protein